MARKKSQAIWVGRKSLAESLVALCETGWAFVCLHSDKSRSRDDVRVEVKEIE